EEGCPPCQVDQVLGRARRSDVDPERQRTPLLREPLQGVLAAVAEQDQEGSRLPGGTGHGQQDARHDARGGGTKQDGRVVFHREMPRARAASLTEFGTVRRASSHVRVTMGIMITASASDPERVLNTMVGS